MSDPQQTAFIPWRFYLAITLLVLCASSLFFRVFDLAILNQHFLRHQGDERALRLVSAKALRGMIVDRNGYPLAVSANVYDVWVNPQKPLTHEQTKALAAVLELKPKLIATTIKLHHTKSFAYLKRAISPLLATRVRELQIPGVYLQEGFKRFYPEGDVAAHVIGFTNIDDRGQEGIELAYNQWLQGEAGKKFVNKDRMGRIINDVETLQPQQPGKDLVLSIDRRLQYLAYRELTRAVTEHQAQSASVIILDIKTGEVLAMVNLPSYDPNHKPDKVDERFRNRAVTDSFEPGSTIKAFSVASALDSGNFTADSIIPTAGWWRVGHNIVRDERNFGPLTLAQILQVSSNIGVSKLILSTSGEQYADFLHRVGFGEITGIEFPGEQSGAMIDPGLVGHFTLATLSYGYGISVTAIQLARAYAVIANQGNKIPVTLLKQNQPPQGKVVMTPHVASEMLMLLESVVTKGTGRLAHVPGYRVAGKTGTAKLSGIKGYQAHRYTSSFVGIAPVTHPKLVVAVVIHDPLGKAYAGGAVAGPAFSKIMAGALRILNIPQDA